MRLQIQKSEVSNEIHKLEQTITLQREELKNSLLHQIKENNMKVQQMVNENVELRQENRNLKERLDKLVVTANKQCNLNRNSRTTMGELCPNETKGI